MSDRIYLDNHATTPLDPRVLEAMMPYLTHRFGNPSSGAHAFGWEAEEAIERARCQVAALVGVEPDEVIFTSGATEAINLALLGAWEAPAREGSHLVTSAIEHKAVLQSAGHLETRGARVTRLPVDSNGIVRRDDLARALTDDTFLVSVMAANNEIGVLQDTAAFAAMCRDRGILFHTDAVQAAGRIPLDLAGMGVAMASLSAHKLYGPKGTGALILRRPARKRVVPRTFGGGHEAGWRAGTPNVPGIVGFGEACDIARREMEEENGRVAALRDRLHRLLADALPEIHLNGHAQRRLSGNLHLSFAGVESESLALSIENVAVSTGSACTSGDGEPSYILQAIGREGDLLHGGIRFGLGRFTTAEEVDEAARRVIAAVRRLRSMSPLWARRHAAGGNP